MEAFDFSNVKEEKHNIFSGIAKTLRILELCLALLFLSWFLTRLPFALKLSADCLRSPLFVFAISNAIIAALLAQSGLFTTATSLSEADSVAPSAQDKQITNHDSCTVTDYGLPKVYRRSQSETLKRKGEDGNKMEKRKLRRSETEKEKEQKKENLYPQDKLSNEEFQRTIEAFIAKQMRFLREESLAIFVQPSEPTTPEQNRLVTNWSC